MTTPYNALKYGGISPQGIKEIGLPCLNSTAAIKQGDLVYFDTTAHLLKPIATDANATTKVGVALQPSIVSANLDNTGAPLPKSLQVGSEGVFFLITTAAETYFPGTVVYIGATAQTVTTDDNGGASTHPIGKVVLPEGVTSVTGVAGLRIPVYVPALYI